LFSLPGTPILYYGDEIGMGDNIYLGDRNGVRTPMQWSSDRNAGFSRAVPARLYSPVIMDPVYGYEAVNVEAQQSDPSSLLNWMRNMIALRKLFRVFGRGTMEVLPTSNRKVLAYVRQDDTECVLCLANLSRFAQPVSLDLARFEGFRPTEMLGVVDFPTIGRSPYPLTLGPYGFLWFELQPSPEAATLRSEAPPFVVGRQWLGVLPQPGEGAVEWPALREFLARQRWFARTSTPLRTVAVVDGVELEPERSVLLLLDVSLDDAARRAVLLPVAFACSADAARIEEAFPAAVIQRASVAGREGVLFDGSYDATCRRHLLTMIAGGKTHRTVAGTLTGVPGSGCGSITESDLAGLESRDPVADQSNTSLFFGERFMLKLYRRLVDGVNPEQEMGAFLTEQARFVAAAPYLGHLSYAPDGREEQTVALLQGFVPNEGDAWQWTLEELERYFEACAAAVAPVETDLAPAIVDQWLSGAVSARAREHLGLYIDVAALLGTRTAELHLALASAKGGDFTVERQSTATLTPLAEQMTENFMLAIDGLKKRLSDLPDDAVEGAGLVLARRHEIGSALRAFPECAEGIPAIRVHGDLHLGQVLRTRHDVVVVDFEGEPSRTLEQRRARHSPLKDVAGMLASFMYAAHRGLFAFTARRPESWERLEPWARLWAEASGAEFLRAYRAVAGSSALLPQEPRVLRAVLEVYVLDKVLYELRYEMEHRPTWVRVPLKSLLAVAAVTGGSR
ncbi:MAG: putative maltokinase, partial [Vicinamibacterales bacterium]